MSMTRAGWKRATRAAVWIALTALTTVACTRTSSTAAVASVAQHDEVLAQTAAWEQDVTAWQALCAHMREWHDHHQINRDSIIAPTLVAHINRIARQEAAIAQFASDLGRHRNRIQQELSAGMSTGGGAPSVWDEHLVLRETHDRLMASQFELQTEFDAFAGNVPRF